VKRLITATLAAVALPLSAWASAGAHMLDVTSANAGERSITASTANTAVITVVPGPATHFSIAAPATPHAQVPFVVTITALDANNAVATGYLGTVVLTESPFFPTFDAPPWPYTFTPADLGVHTFTTSIIPPFVLTMAGSGAITATDTADASITGSTAITVIWSPADHFVFPLLTGVPNLTAGTPLYLSGIAYGSDGGFSLDYTGTVRVTSSSAGTFPPDHQVTLADYGTFILEVTLTTLGAQTVTVADTNNASVKGTVPIMVTCSGLVVDALNNGPSCPGGDVRLSAITNAIAGTTFAWTGPGGFTSAQQNPTVTVPGSYNVTLTVGSCAATSSTNVVFTDTPPLAITAPASVCSNHLTTASVASAGPGATYNWTIDGGTIAIGAGTNNVTFSAPVTSATVALHVSVSTPGGCPVSASKTINVTPNPGATLPAVIEVCGPQTVTIPITLTGTAPWTILWADGTGQDNITTSTPTRTFKATTSTPLGIIVLYDASCNSASPTNFIQIKVGDAPFITAEPHDAFVASGSPSSFNVSAAGSNLHFQWFRQESDGTAKPAGTDAPSFTIDPVSGNSTVWVVIFNECGTVESTHVQAGPETSRRHAAGH
jgi:hypothetical protein